MAFRNFSPIRRQEYLSSQWSGYGLPPEGAVSLSQAHQGQTQGAWLAGTLLSLCREHGQIHVRCRSQGVEQSWQLDTLTLSDGHSPQASFLPEEVLLPGDKVALRTTASSLGEILLLSPALRELAAITLTPERARQWAQFLKVVRDFFVSQGFLEVSTPTLVICPGTEPSLEPFVTEFKRGRERRTMHLPTSPELHLKKLLAQGWSEIFEIRSCFRNDEGSATHEPEFTMMEWYRAYQRLPRIFVDLERLLQTLAKGHMLSGDLLPTREMSVAQLFEICLAKKLHPETSRDELRYWAEQLGLHVTDEDSWNDVFHRLWIEKIEPWIAAQPEPLIVKDFPPTQAALAQINAQGWADRAELYWRGLEIANGFQELTDPEEQRRRFARDAAERSHLGRSPVPLDEDFLVSLEGGLPPTAGIALGLERLFMAALKVSRIQDLKAFPLCRD